MRQKTKKDFASKWFLCGALTTTGTFCKIRLVSGTCQFHGTVGPGSCPVLYERFHGGENDVELTALTLTKFSNDENTDFSIIDNPILIKSANTGRKNVISEITPPYYSTGVLLDDDCFDAQYVFECVKLGRSMRDLTLNGDQVYSMAEKVLASLEKKLTAVIEEQLNSFYNQVPVAHSTEQSLKTTTTTIVSYLVGDMDEKLYMVKETVKGMEEEEYLFCPKSQRMIDIEDLQYLIRYFEFTKGYDYTINRKLGFPILNLYKRLGINKRVLKDGKAIDNYISFAVNTARQIRSIIDINPINSSDLDSFCENYGGKCGYRGRLYDTFNQWTNQGVLSIEQYMCGIAAAFYIFTAGGIESTRENAFPALKNDRKGSAADEVLSVAADTTMAALVGGATPQEAWLASCVSVGLPIPPQSTK